MIFVTFVNEVGSFGHGVRSGFNPPLPRHMHGFLQFSLPPTSRKSQIGVGDILVHVPLTYIRRHYWFKLPNKTLPALYVEFKP